MKTKAFQKIELKKLTIAKINMNTMSEVKGGTSGPVNTDGCRELIITRPVRACGGW